MTIASHDSLVHEYHAFSQYGGTFASSTHFPDPFATSLNDNGSPSRERGDLMLYRGFGHPPLMLDMRIPNPVTAEVERGTVAEKEDRLRASVHEKNNKYKEKCRAVGIEFLPFCIDSYGLWDDGASQLFDSMITAAVEMKKIDP